MLTSLQNEQVKNVIALQRRKERELKGQFVIEGWRFIKEALTRNGQIIKVFVCPEQVGQDEKSVIELLYKKGISVVEVDKRVMDKMSTTEHPQGILAVMAQKRNQWDNFFVNSGTSKAEEKPCYLIVDGVQDPGNLGTILRTALAAGVNHVVLTKGTVDLYNPKVLRSTMGALFSMIIITEAEPEEVVHRFTKQGVKLVMADAKGVSLYELNRELWNYPLALIVGNEGNGPCPAFREKVSTTISIPMANEVESLNVAMATGIILYERVRQNITIKAEEG